MTHVPWIHLFSQYTQSITKTVHYCKEARLVVRRQRPGESGIGARVRELRRERRLSVRTLAGRTGFSPSFISQMEAEAVSPSIASLEKVAEELGVSLGQFFSSLESAPREVVRREERPEYESGWSKSTVALLADAAPGRKLSAAEISVEPGGSSGKRAAFGMQEAILLLLSGVLVVGLEGREVELFEGDSVYGSGGTEFSWENSGSEKATLLMVATPGKSDIVSALLDVPETQQ